MHVIPEEWKPYATKYDLVAIYFGILLIMSGIVFLTFNILGHNASEFLMSDSVFYFICIFLGACLLYVLNTVLSRRVWKSFLIGDFKILS